MFCMNCGKQLPDGAKFCKFCGTPQGAVSPTGTAQAENINLDGMHTFAPAMCPNCNAHMSVDSSSRIAHCDTCGTECLVQDAIKALTVKGNVKVGNATINVSGTNTDSLLERVEIMLADGDFDGAIKKCDAILDAEPKNGKAYFYMLMANLKCRTRKELANQRVSFDKNQYYSRAVQYCDDDLKAELIDYSKASKTRLESDLKEKRKHPPKDERDHNSGQIEAIKVLVEERNKEFEVKRKNLKIGDEFYYGTYPNEFLSKGKKVLWKVLNIQDDKALIICSDTINGQKFHNSDGSAIWRDCTLRKWLNNDFFGSFFTKTEKTRILPSEIKTVKKQKLIKVGSVTTTDYVFLLSVQEANELFADDEARKLVLYNSSYSWWLRSPGKSPDFVARVLHDGKIDANGQYSSSNEQVRPAMWINLDDQTVLNRSFID